MWRDDRGRFLPIDPGCLDPRFLPSAVPFVPVYLDDHANMFAVVDREDWPWVSQHRWRASRSGPANTHRYWYARRETREGGRTINIYLHRAVMLRVAPQPNDYEYIVDHINGNKMDNRRRNLRWATPKENRYNRYGQHQQEFNFQGA